MQDELVHVPQVRTPRSRVRGLTEAAALALGGTAPSAAAFRRQRDALAVAAFAECAAAAKPSSACPVIWLLRIGGRCLCKIHAHRTSVRTSGLWNRAFDKLGCVRHACGEACVGQELSVHEQRPSR